MSLRINHNIAALNAHRNLVLTTTNLSNSMEKLSSGYRINRAADNPAGLVISEQFRAQIAGLNQAIANSEGSINMIQTAEGALTEINTLLVQMRELTIHAANEGFNDTAQLEADQAEIDNAILTIDRIAANTQFGTKKLLDGSDDNIATFTTDGSSGIQVRKSYLSDGTHYITATKMSESSATLNTQTYGVSIDNMVTPANLSDGIHNLNVIQSGAAAIKDDGRSISVVDDFGNAIEFGALTTKAIVVASAGGAAAAATTDNSGIYTAIVSYQEADQDTLSNVSLSITINASAAATVGVTAILNKFNNVINASSLAGKVVAGTTAAGTICFESTGTGANYSLEITSLSTDAVTAWAGFTAGDDSRGISNVSLRFEVVSNASYDFPIQQIATVTLTAGQYATMDALLTEINDKLDDALGTGFGEAAAGVANVYASTSGPNNDRIKFTTADWGSAYSIKAMVTNADDEWEANYALGIGIDSVAHTGTDGLIQLDDYVNAINRIDYGLDRNYVIGDAESGTEDRGTIGVTIRGLTTGGGGLHIGNALLDVDAARFAVYLDGGAPNTVIAGVETTVQNTSGDERLKIYIDLDAIGGSETIANSDRSLVFQIGANVGQTVKIALPNMAANALSRNVAGNMFNSLAEINVTTVQGAQDAQSLIDAAIDEVSEVRGTLGSFQKNTLESNLKNLRIAAQNLQSSESNIRDTDMALEMSTFVKNQILLQAGTAMLAQANQVPQVVLSLFG